MKPIGGSTRFGSNISFLPQQCWRPLRAAALTLLLVGLSVGVSAAPMTSTSKARDHVYLLRGAFNVFSLGMDEIAARLEQQGIETSVDNYVAWPTLADEAAADYKSGRVRTIILVGHSSGAVAVTSMAARLGQLGVPVKLAIGLDPTSEATTSGHVDLYINYYIANGLGEPVDKGRRFTGVLENVDVERMANIGHFNIDKNKVLQARVISEIHAALRAAPVRGTDAATKHDSLKEGTAATAGR
ncbi:MAG TPA: hypothetical protein VGJ20_06535 [Xanthobacteraceae bacterium]